ncbi:transcriptional regulator [Paracraurococcus ruber]|uniref:XRE family transcriptional regulator n=1 Tax=Paracraurococcus ruber TaxID=77675 RepID=A0ABS1CR11_9PROT|nr:hypothetical protein [Paracraurococcus ruber]TDG34032.1 transcriptional regulator [Paracraurococcus ruber]
MRPVEVYALLRKRIREAGGPSAFARQAGVSPQLVSDADCGRRFPGPSLLAALGLRRVEVVRYVPLGGQAGAGNG